MSDEELKELAEQEASVTHIDQARVARLKAKGQYWAMYEHFDLLRTKFIYGEPMTVEFLSFVRNEKKFSSLEEIKAQIHKDVQIVKKEFADEKL